MSRTYYLIASLVAPLAALLVPIGLALFELHAEPPILPDGSADDAGTRGVGVFLAIVLPICFPLACIYYAVVGKILARLKRFTFKANLSFAAAARWVLVAIALPSFVRNSPDSVLSLSLIGIIGTLMSLFAMLGAFVWWIIATGKVSSNSIFHTDGPRR